MSYIPADEDTQRAGSYFTSRAAFIGTSAVYSVTMTFNEVALLDWV
jgi:hypothetical protein